MHLLSHTRKKSSKTYTYYSLAESYWEDKKNKKRVLCYLGRLTPLQAQKIRNALRVTRSLDTFVASFDDILFDDHWSYLDVAFLNHLWDDWGLSDVFPSPEETSHTRKKDISTADIAKALTFYRCLEPGSYLSSAEWFEGTACDHILGIDGSHFNDSRVYRELTMIDALKEKLEKYLYTTLRERDEEAFKVIFYDLSDSYFEGTKCKLAKPGITKANGFKSKKIVLSLLLNSKGYPFSWEILEDYTSDVKTLTANADQWKERFDLPKIISVFDRGMVSDENLKHLEESETYLYITALDKDQVAGVPGVRLDRFKDLTVENVEKKVGRSRFLTKYDDCAYYEDLGTAEGSVRRHILGFNPELFKDQRKQREEQIKKALDCLKEEGAALLKAKKSRQKKPTEQRIDRKLKKLNVTRFIGYELKEIELESGVRTFELSYRKKTKAIEKAKLTDGLWVLVTSITADTQPREFRLGPEEIIRAYRDKNRVEEAFRELKSFIKFKPTFVYTREHVRAHYTICVLSYLLDVTVTNGLRESPIKGVGSVGKAYQIMGRCEVGKVSVRGTDLSGKKLMPLNSTQRAILKLLNCEYLGEKEYLKPLGINSM